MYVQDEMTEKKINLESKLRASRKCAHSKSPTLNDRSHILSRTSPRRKVVITELREKIKALEEENQELKAQIQQLSVHEYRTSSFKQEIEELRHCLQCSKEEEYRLRKSLEMDAGDMGLTQTHLMLSPHLAHVLTSPVRRSQTSETLRTGDDPLVRSLFDELPTQVYEEPTNEDSVDEDVSWMTFLQTLEAVKNALQCQLGEVHMQGSAKDLYAKLCTQPIKSWYSSLRECYLQQFQVNDCTFLSFAAVAEEQRIKLQAGKLKNIGRHALGTIISTDNTLDLFIQVLEKDIPAADWPNFIENSYVRKFEQSDPLYNYFQLSCGAVKLGLQLEMNVTSFISNRPTLELYLEVHGRAIPFQDWHDYVRRYFISQIPQDVMPSYKENDGCNADAMPSSQKKRLSMF